MGRGTSKKTQGSGSGGRTDPAWKYGTQVEGPTTGTGKSYVYVDCRFCSKTITGGIKRLKNHLACNHDNVAPCLKVPIEVKEEMKAYLAKGAAIKKISEENFDFLVNRGSYLGGNSGSGVAEGGSTPISGSVIGASSSGPSGGGIPSRGVRGPIDRFMTGNDEMDNRAQAGVGEQRVLAPHNGKEHRNRVCLDIGRFFFENGLSFNVANSPSFVNMLRSVGEYGRGLKAPTMYEMTTWILKEEVNTTNKMIEDVKKTWPMTGVTIMSDGWTDIRGRQLLNFLVNCPEGTIFLKSIDASEAIKDSNMLFKLLDEIVEEVGEEHVVQVVTDNAAAYKKAGEKLMEKRRGLYWTPCAAHCIDLMLEKIYKLPQLAHALRKARQVSNFIYGHGWVLALMRSFTKRELIRPAATRFATANLTLQSMLQNKQGLESMFVSTKWNNCSWAKKEDGKAVKKIITRDNHFWPSLIYSLKATKPLVGVLRLVDSEEMPAMGFIYGAMDKAKEDIAKNFDNDVSKYKEIWDIIDEKWDFQMHRYLHAAAYFLNPQFQYESNVSTHPEIKLGLYNCMDKLIPDSVERGDAHMEIDTFLRKEGLFGRPEAETTRMRKAPARWWASYGDSTPILTKFAIRVLSLTCTSSACERNWSTFNQVHTKRRNRLHSTKLNALVFIMYNKKLRVKQLQRRIKMEKNEEDTLVVEEIDSDDEWLVETPIELGPNENEGEEEISGSGSRSRSTRMSVESPSPTTNWQKDLDELDINALQFEVAELDPDCPQQPRTRTQAQAGCSRGRQQSSKRGRGATGKGKSTMPMRLVDEADEWEEVESDKEDDRGRRYNDDSLGDGTSDEDDINIIG